ncbi:MAG TPA: DUF4394 domain-containing protein [Solirubrobacteraceae bacterium]|jgi:hypothetical protein
MRLRLILAGAGAAAALAAPAPALAAEAFYGVTADNQLVTFQSDSPGHVLRSVPLTGLVPGEQILGVDIRPLTGQLYALGATNRIYVVSPLSGAATPVGDPFTPPLAGTSFGFDFSPQADRIRVVSDGRQNLRIAPENGQVAAQDNALGYAEGDPNAGALPQVGAAAYTNNVPNAPDTQLLGIDSGRDVLVFQNPPASGILNTVGPLNVDIAGGASFDIGVDGRGWVAAQRAGAAGAELFAIDLKTGALAPAAKRPLLATGNLRGIAAAGPVPDDLQRPDVLIAVDRRQKKRSLRRTLRVAVSCSETCVLAGELLRGDRRVGSAEGGLTSAGRTKLTFKATNKRRRLARRSGEVKLKVRVVATDAAGNDSATRRTLRFG